MRCSGFISSVGTEHGCQDEGSGGLRNLSFILRKKELSSEMAARQWSIKLVHNSLAFQTPYFIGNLPLIML